MDYLIVISSKSQNPYLYSNIESLIKIQINNNILTTKICIIDSDSDNIDNYTKVIKDFPFVEVHFIKNKNYEYGAFKYAYSIYSLYNYYICIQDTTLCNKKIPLDIVNNNNAFIFFHDS